MNTSSFSSPRSVRNSLLLPALTGGFAAAVGLWILWFLTHLPWIQLDEKFSILILLAYWIGAAWFVSRRFPVERPVVVGILSGVITAAVGLLVLGSKLAEAPKAGEDLAGPMKPNAALMVAGFLTLGGVIGGVTGLWKSWLPGRPRAADEVQDWARRFALVTAGALLPLLLIGGLVTSTDSGMAVPDWPNTFGTNMFLYPLGPRARPDVYLEHAHRLFGTLVGLTAIVLLLVVFLTDRRRWVRVWTVVLLLAIIGQGILGAQRVLADNRWMAFGHGVLGQLIFAWAVALAGVLSLSFRADPGALPPTARRVRLLATAAIHTTILQLLFGAMYRHIRSDHPLWAHIGFSVLVLTLALLAGFASRALNGDSPLQRNLRTVGLVSIVVVVVQFLLGWATFLFGGRQHDPESVFQALLRSAHQFNGAILLGLLTWAGVVARRIPRGAPTEILTQPERGQ